MRTSCGYLPCATMTSHTAPSASHVDRLEQFVVPVAVLSGDEEDLVPGSESWPRTFLFPCTTVYARLGHSVHIRMLCLMKF